ncbi:MAG: GIY-YIG nuclease family protein [Candidatus Omnitrophica bacterium]|nr:GIY-YIG nuclease family protein [Candidatus Omnitrophota bacterium]
MRKKDKRLTPPEVWRTYIIRCKGGLLYTGITNNLEKRIKAHNSGKGCKFTKYRTPVKLIHSESCLTKSSALMREAEIKRLRRVEKLKLSRK